MTQYYTMLICSFISTFVCKIQNNSVSDQQAANLPQLNLHSNLNIKNKNTSKCLYGKAENKYNNF